MLARSEWGRAAAGRLDRGHGRRLAVGTGGIRPPISPMQHARKLRWRVGGAGPVCRGRSLTPPTPPQFEHTMLVTETGVELLTARLPNSRRDVTTTFAGVAGY